MNQKNHYLCTKLIQIKAMSVVLNFFLNTASIPFTERGEARFLYRAPHSVHKPPYTPLYIVSLTCVSESAPQGCFAIPQRCGSHFHYINNILYIIL
jgi:hypothetical protein